MKRVSHLLAVKNRVSYVKWFFDNFKEYSVPGDELIVIDGDSTDGTKELLKENSNLMDVFVSEPDSSAGEATNKGILLASGEYIKTQSIDDVIYNIDEPVNYMNQNRDIDLLILGGVKQRGEKTLRTIAPSEYGNRFEDVLLYGACGAGFLIRRNSFDRIGLFDAKFIGNDREFALRAIKRGVVRFYPGIFYWHRVSMNSLGVLNFDKWHGENYDLIKEYCPEIHRLMNEAKSLVKEPIQGLVFD